MVREKIDLTVTRLYKENSEDGYKIYLNRGGVRSSKTYTLVEMAVLWLIGSTDNEEPSKWSIVRKTRPSLMATAYLDFEEIVTKLKLWPFINANRSSMRFTHRNRTIEFFGLDDEQKLRSRKRKHLHICEGNEIDFKTFTSLTLRTRGKIYIDWNPSDEHHWLREELEIKRAALKKDVKVIVSTYRDNPYLTQSEIEEIEYLKKVDPALWAVFGEGEYGSLTDLIYDKFELDDYSDDYDYQYLGIDFGFSFSPAAVILVGLRGDTLYLKELVYATGLTNTQLAERIAETGYGDLPTVADSAEPKSITDLNIEGLNVASAVKGKDSVRNGITSVRKYKLVVDPASVNLIKELRTYKWNDKKAGVPIPAYDHLLDALRYVVAKFMRETGGFTYGGSVSGTKPFSS